MSNCTLWEFHLPPSPLTILHPSFTFCLLNCHRGLIKAIINNTAQNSLPSPSPPARNSSDIFSLCSLPSLPLQVQEDFPGGPSVTVAHISRLLTEQFTPTIRSLKLLMPRDDARSSIKPIIRNSRRIQITRNFIMILIKQLRYVRKELSGTGFKAFRICVSCQVDSDLCETIHTRYKGYRDLY